MGKDTRLGIVWMAASTLLYVIQEAILKNLTSNISVFNLVLFRNLFGFLFFLPLLIKTGIEPLKIVNKKMLLLRAISGFGAMVSYIYALKNGAFLMIGSISLLVPIISILLVAVFLKETLPSRIRYVFILSVFAAALITFSQQNLQFNLNTGALLALISVFFNAANFVIIKLLTKTETNLTISLWMSITQIIFSLPFSIISYQWPENSDMIWIAIAGILAILGQITMAQALRISNTNTMITTSFLRFVWVFMISLFFFNEVPHFLEILGAGILVLSITAISYKK